MRWRWLTAFLVLLGACEDAERAPDTVRFATYNLHLARSEAGKLITELQDGSAQIEAVVAVLKVTNPDVLFINELDFDKDRAALALLQERLAAHGLTYAYTFVAPVNTGQPTKLDLTGDGKDYGPENAQGWGVFEGQFGMALLSRLPILSDEVRTFRQVRWYEMPNTLYPPDYFPDEARDVLRLSSKSHWDVPIQAGGRVINLLLSHPTPPVFDGDEDRNGRRNHDEIRFWTDYISGADWMLSDQGTKGGLDANSAFVVMGDLNNDPERGDGRKTAIQGLLGHPRVQDTVPKGEAGTATAQFDKVVGQLRVDYVLPSVGLEVLASGVVWPEDDETMSAIAHSASDHRLVGVDLRLPGVGE